MTRARLRQAGNAAQIEDILWNSHYLRACRGETSERTPIWLMRQAGRYMAEYRAVRKDHNFLQMCYQPELAAEVTVTAQRVIGADAAIIFADILLILDKLGMNLTFAAGEGPRLNPPLRSAADIAALGNPQQAAADCHAVADACRMTRAELPADVPLIGFCGAPYTVASYAIEGAGSRQFAQTRSLMYQDPQSWHRLQEHLVASMIPYLQAQVEAGAQALQIFDSWVGKLTIADYREFVLPHMKELVAALPEGIAVTIFGTETTHLLSAMAEAGSDVLGLDTTADLDACWQALGGPEQISVQGNLDPALLLGPRDRLLGECDKVLAAAAGRPGHIFNLGHGVLKETDVQQVIDLIAHVHARTTKDNR